MAVSYELEEVIKVTRFAREVARKAAWTYGAYALYFLANALAHLVASGT